MTRKTGFGSGLNHSGSITLLLPVPKDTVTINQCLDPDSPKYPGPNPDLLDPDP
jgi:hypothetical protein